MEILGKMTDADFSYGHIPEKIQNQIDCTKVVVVKDASATLQSHCDKCVFYNLVACYLVKCQPRNSRFGVHVHFKELQ